MLRKPLFLEELKDYEYRYFIKEPPRVEFVEDTWIVTGLKLNPPAIDKITLDKYEFGKAKKICEFKKLKIENIEFHDCDFSWSQWVLCTFKKVKFFKCKIKNVKFWNPKFEETEFHKVSFMDTLMGADLDGGSGIYSNATFIECDLKRTNYVSPVFKKCLFKNCNFDQIRTNGCDFDNVKFEGYLKSIIFYDKYDWRPNTMLNFLLRKKKNKKNVYHKVDFSNAKLGDVGFRGDIDLAEITLPADNDILIVENPWDIFSKMKDVINKEWTGENKRIALSLINSDWLVEQNKGRKNFIFLKHIDYEVLGEDYADKFYKLLESISH